MIVTGDCLEAMRAMEPDSMDALVTDPPAGISFMGESWDSDKGGSEQWIAWLSEIMREALRVLKPGAHGLVWALPRTSHWTGTALERAGFEVRDVITHLFGTGFPKSLDISKAIDRAAGAEREVVWSRIKAGDIKGSAMHSGSNVIGVETLIEYTAPTTDAAKQWQGFGTALKPSAEMWFLVRKKLGEKTVAANVLKHGTGGLNIDASRIPGAIPQVPQPSFKTRGSIYNMKTCEGRNGDMSRAEGRFPSNLVLSHSLFCTDDACEPDCAVAMLDAQSGERGGGYGVRGNGGNKYASGKGFSNALAETGQTIGYGDTGGASRFFFCAKASKADRGEGNSHPTVKSTKLMSYLIKLITPPGGTVLDPFAGSGSTGVAAKREGFGFVGIEQNAEYAAIAERRIGA